MLDEISRADAGLCYRQGRVPDDDRKARRLGDETKGRIAELASGWTVDGESPPAPEPLPRREASGPSSLARDAARKAKPIPPPPPGSVERKVLEDKPNLPPPKLPSGPPPVPRGRASSGQVPTVAKPASRDGVPGAAPAEADKTKENRGAVGIGPDNNGSLTTNSASGTIGGDTPSPVFDRAAIAAGSRGAVASAPASAAGSGPTSARGTPQPARSAASDSDPPGPDPRLAVPVGEFDHVETVLEQHKRQIAHDQKTIVRDAASALLGLAEPLTTREPTPVEVSRDDPTELRGDSTLPEHNEHKDTSGGPRHPRHDSSASSTGRFERADPTLGDARGDETATQLAGTGRAPVGTLRNPAALPRRRGIAGDVRYVATVVFGLRETRREIAALAAKQATRQQSRRHHLVTLGRTAVALPEFLASAPRTAGAPGAFEHPALGPAREQLAAIEDERSQHAGHVVAADAELVRVRRDREAKAAQYATDLAALDSELVSLAKRLEPLDKEVAGLKRRAAEMHDSLRRIDDKIAATEASLSSGKSKKLDPADVMAEIASLRADRKAIQADEPAIAGELDALTPRIAALEATRLEAQRRRAELETAEHDDQRRVEELLTAIGAKRKVVDRAAADAEAARDKVLFQLGERLYVDRPADLTAQLAPIDEIDVELGLADRRMMELREVLASVDRWKLARGIALLVLVIGGLGTVAGWLFLYAR